MALSTLGAIQKKVRILTRALSPAQLSDADLNQYINTFVEYDFPASLRTFNLRTQFTFTCNPYQAEYSTNEIDFAGNTTNELYDFRNRYLTVHPPVYIGGFEALYSQSRDQFYGLYPMVNSINSIGVTGNGAETRYEGRINTQQSIVPANLNQNISLLPGEVLFSSVTAAFAGLAMIDVPVIDNTTGNPFPYGNLYSPNNLPTTPPIARNVNNYINYATGQFVVTFDAPPGPGVAINSQTVPTVLSRPQALLFYADNFVVRPVPDQPYRINFEVYVKPAELLSTNQSPQLKAWWQYIAYGAAKKVFEDRMDTDSVQQIMPEFKKQEALCLSTTVVQLTNQRPATIYEGTLNGSRQGFGNWNGPF